MRARFLTAVRSADDGEGADAAVLRTLAKKQALQQVSAAAKTSKEVGPAGAVEPRALAPARRLARLAAPAGEPTARAPCLAFPAGRSLPTREPPRPPPPPRPSPPPSVKQPLH